MTKAFFLDRDGVVNRDPHPEPYVVSWEEWEWMPGIRELLEEIKRQGFLTILVTSQKGVGKGVMSTEALEEIHERMQRELGDLRFAAIHAYTGLPGCAWKPKPNPEMVLAAAREYNLSLADSWLLGDADRDITMGRAAGVGTLVRLEGLKPVTEISDFTIRDLAEATALLRSRAGA
jgi:D-glycero-D-manno-heptose 1,7-bisphosphate phosphatase